MLRTGATWRWHARVPRCRLERRTRGCLSPRAARLTLSSRWGGRDATTPPGEALCEPGHSTHGCHGPCAARLALSSRWGGSDAADADATPRRAKPGMGRGTTRADATALALLS